MAEASADVSLEDWTAMHDLRQVTMVGVATVALGHVHPSWKLSVFVCIIKNGHEFWLSLEANSTRASFKLQRPFNLYIYF